MAQQLSVAPLPFIYKAFFLYIEPVATAVGAYYAWFQQDEYMRLTYSTPADVLVSSAIARHTTIQMRCGRDPKTRVKPGTYVATLPYFQLPRNQFLGSLCGCLP